MLKIKHKRTRPYTPRTNGKAERFVQTSLREWAKPTQGSGRRSLLEWSAEGYAKPYNHSSERAAALLPFLHDYNHHRLHFGLTDAPYLKAQETTYRETTTRACRILTPTLATGWVITLNRGTHILNSTF